MLVNILFLWLFWRLFLFFISFVGARLFIFSPHFPYSDIFLIPSSLPVWFWSFANFDGVHYLTIIDKGYSAQFTQVFFPLFPLLVSLINFVLPFISPLFLGIVLSSLLFLLFLFIFNRLLKLDFNKKTTIWTLLFLLFFPTSFFFGAIYTESLFMVLMVLSFYLARKKRWILAAVIASFSSATRLIGIFLLPSLLWEQYQSQDKIKNQKFLSVQAGKIKNRGIKFKLQDIFLRICDFVIFSLKSPFLYIVPLGLVAYMIYLQLRFGDFLYFWHAQPVFGAQRSGSGVILFPQVVWRYLKILTTVSWKLQIYWISLLELVSTIMAVFLLIFAQRKKIRSSYLIFSWLSLIIPTLTGTLSSMPRYILVIFPIFIVLGLVKGRLLKSAILAFFITLLIVLTTLFTRGYWVS